MSRNHRGAFGVERLFRSPVPVAEEDDPVPVTLVEDPARDQFCVRGGVVLGRGAPPVLMRPPQGRTDDNVSAVYEEAGAGSDPVDFMGRRAVADLVSFCGHAPQSLRTGVDVALALDEERDVHVLLLEDVQELRRGRARPPVEGEGDALLDGAVRELRAATWLVAGLRGRGLKGTARRLHVVQSAARTGTQDRGDHRAEQGDPGRTATAGTVCRRTPA